MLAGREQEAFFAHNTYWSPSGGSGARPPLYFPTAVEENLEQRRRLSRWLVQYGVMGSHTVALNLFSGSNMYRACEIFTDYVQLCGGTVLPAAFQARDEAVVQIYEKFAPNMIMGMPGRLVQLAHHLSQSLPVERLIYASETLVPAAERLLNERFGRPSISSFMGSAEAGVWGFSRPGEARNLFWAPRELVHLEVDQPDNQGYGSLVVSNLLRFRHPLLRYDSGDRARLLEGFVEGVVGVELAGRHSQSFQFGGQYYEVAEFAAILELASAYQFVLRFEERDWLTLRLVGPEEIAERALLLLRAVVRAHADRNRVDVEICRPEELTCAYPSNKVLPIVDRR